MSLAVLAFVSVLVLPVSYKVLPSATVTNQTTHHQEGTAKHSPFWNPPKNVVSGWAAATLMWQIKAVNDFTYAEYSVWSLNGIDNLLGCVTSKLFSTLLLSENY